MKVPFLDLNVLQKPFSADLLDVARRVIDSGHYVLGPEVEAFEHEFAAFVGARHAVGVASGLDALSLILRAWKEQGRLAPGDRVIVPANTYIASLLAITENSMQPLPVSYTHLTLPTKRIA